MRWENAPGGATLVANHAILGLKVVKKGTNYIATFDPEVGQNAFNIRGFLDCLGSWDADSQSGSSAAD